VLFKKKKGKHHHLSAEGTTLVFCYTHWISYCTFLIKLFFRSDWKNSKFTSHCRSLPEEKEKQKYYEEKLPLTTGGALESDENILRLGHFKTFRTM
jgi:hypothetical protein